MRSGLALAALLLLAVPAVAASCMPVQEMDDPAGDTTVPSNVPPGLAAPADILHVRMERGAVGVTLSVRLAADPRASPAGTGPATYSYWVGFEDGGKSDGGNPPTWTFQGSTTYGQIDTMYWGKAPATLPVAWNGTTMSFIVPWTAFKSQYGTTLPDFGSPFAATSGPSAGGTNNPSEDAATYSRDLVPLPDCATGPGAPASTQTSASSPTTTPSATQAHGTSSEAGAAASVTQSSHKAAAPALPWTAASLALLAGLMRRRR